MSVDTAPQIQQPDPLEAYRQNLLGAVEEYADRAVGDFAEATYNDPSGVHELNTPAVQEMRAEVDAPAPTGKHEADIAFASEQHDAVSGQIDDLNSKINSGLFPDARVGEMQEEIRRLVQEQREWRVTREQDEDAAQRLRRQHADNRQERARDLRDLVYAEAHTAASDRLGDHQLAFYGVDERPTPRPSGRGSSVRPAGGTTGEPSVGEPGSAPGPARVVIAAPGALDQIAPFTRTAAYEDMVLGRRYPRPAAGGGGAEPGASAGQGPAGNGDPYPEDWPLEPSREGEVTPDVAGSAAELNTMEAGFGVFEGDIDDIRNIDPKSAEAEELLDDICEGILLLRNGRMDATDMPILSQLLEAVRINNPSIYSRLNDHLKQVQARKLSGAPRRPQQSSRRPAQPDDPSGLPDDARVPAPGGDDPANPTAPLPVTPPPAGPGDPNRLPINSLVPRISEAQAKDVWNNLSDEERYDIAVRSYDVTSLKQSGRLRKLITGRALQPDSWPRDPESAPRPQIDMLSPETQSKLSANPAERARMLAYLRDAGRVWILDPNARIGTRTPLPELIPPEPYPPLLPTPRELASRAAGRARRAARPSTTARATTAPQPAATTTPLEAVPDAVEERRRVRTRRTIGQFIADQSVLWGGGPRRRNRRVSAPMMTQPDPRPPFTLGSI